jgi:hypothetical protein
MSPYAQKRYWKSTYGENKGGTFVNLLFGTLLEMRCDHCLYLMKFLFGIKQIKYFKKKFSTLKKVATGRINKLEKRI